MAASINYPPYSYRRPQNDYLRAMNLPGHIRRSLIYGGLSGLDVKLVLEYMPKNPSGTQWRYEHGMTASQWVNRAPEVEQEVYDRMVDTLSKEAEALGIAEHELVRMLELAGL